MCVVQESWKFWVRSEVEYGRVPQSDESGLLANGFSNHSDGEAAPLLSAHRHGDSLNGSSVHIHQPNKKERGIMLHVCAEVKYMFTLSKSKGFYLDWLTPILAITGTGGPCVMVSRFLLACEQALVPSITSKISPSTVLSMWVLNYFKQMISSSSFPSFS